MHDPGGFGSGNLLLRPFGVVGWCIIEMEADTSKRIPTLAVSEIPFDVRQDRYTKELPVALHPSRQSKKIMDAERQLNNGNQAFLV
jgi:hypothetical protein